MKWIFLLFLAMFTPVLAGFLRGQPRYIPHACFAMALSLFFLDPYLYVAPVSWAAWPGPVKGIEITIIDAIAVAVIYAARTDARTPTALKFGFGLYAAGIVVSTLANAHMVQPPLFYAWQVCRAVLVFVAVKRATAMYPIVPISIFAALGIGLFYNCVTAVMQFAGGARQAGGAMGHQNTLGLSSHFATMTAFALLLAGRRNLLAAAVVVAGAIIAIVGGSRATIGLFPIGLGIVALLSIRQQMTGRKGAFAAVAGIGLILAIPAMMWAVDRRSAESRAGSNAERAAFIEAAKMIIADHPLGIGGDRYVTVANVGGYSARAGVAWNYANRTAPVHNAYYLVAAELGYLGLMGLLAMIVAVIAEGWKSAKRVVGERADLIVGLTGTTIVVAVHNYFEWLYMTFHIHYLMAMSVGALIGLSRGAQAFGSRGDSSQATSLPLARPRERASAVATDSPLY